MGVPTKLLSPKTVIHVADYAPNGRLTKENFDTAIRAAIQAAYALVGDDQSTIDGYAAHAGIHIMIPEGQWTVNDTLEFPATYPRLTPGLVGVGGLGSVVLMFNKDTLTGPTIRCGSEVEGAELANYTYRQLMKNIDIRFMGDVSTHGGIRSRYSLHCAWEDVSIRGIGQGEAETKYAMGDWEKRIGFDFGAGSEGYNHQHLSITRCQALYSWVGMRVGAMTWTCTAKEMNVDASAVCGVMVDHAAALCWLGGSAQGSGGGAGSPTSPYYQTKGSVLVSGTNTLIESGSNASLSVASGQFSVLTGLTGMKGYDRSFPGTYIGSWIEIVDEGYTSGFDKVGGLYRIEEVLSATSVRIRKGSTHAAVNGQITWRVMGAQGEQNVSLNNVYYEGESYAHTDIASYVDIPSESQWRITNCWGWGLELCARLTGIAGKFEFKKTRYWFEGLLVERCRALVIDTDLPCSKIVIDSVSRNGLTCRASNLTGEVASGTIWQAQVHGHRLNRAVRDRGAVFAIDARRHATDIARSGNDVTTWTDFIGGVAGTRYNAGVAPQFVLSDTELGSPGVVINATTLEGNHAGLLWNLTSKFQTGRMICPTMMLIARTNDTASGGRRVSLMAASFNMSMCLNDDGWSSDAWYVRFWAPPFGERPTGTVADAATTPHIMIANPSMAGVNGGTAPLGVITERVEANGDGGWGGLRQAGEFAFTGGDEVMLRMPQHTGELPGAYTVAYCAIFPEPLTVVECRDLVDLACNEWPVLS